ncbi:hypothetical protein HYH03_018293 [Edaphochlamys debaryana]|uniref:Uncharacterized protein n=1 Tax=Edaphochlamys debaryana TaxID=47281 RepID=A0A836BPP3_9CHLO|nr:hypothetical protein HYH03_018293 [Edaphochlamys debaryana]|eukprot:KAG2482803.1 hypothetical protein HYH03_018293 [Edaphochlamys debaryana]
MAEDAGSPGPGPPGGKGRPAPKPVPGAAKKTSASGGRAAEARPPSAGLTAWDGEANMSADLLSYLGKPEADIAASSASSLPRQHGSMTGDGNLTQALLLARQAAATEAGVSADGAVRGPLSSAPGDAGPRPETRGSAGNGLASSPSGSGPRPFAESLGSGFDADDLIGGEEPSRTGDRGGDGPRPGAGAGLGPSKSGASELRGLLSDDDEDDGEGDEDFQDLMTADEDALFGNSGSGAKAGRGSGANSGGRPGGGGRDSDADGLGVGPMPPAAIRSGSRGALAPTLSGRLLSQASSRSFSGRGQRSGSAGGLGPGPDTTSSSCAGGQAPEPPLPPLESATSMPSPSPSGAPTPVPPGPAGPGPRQSEQAGSAPGAPLLPHQTAQSPQLQMYHQQHYSHLVQNQHVLLHQGTGPHHPQLPTATLGDGLRYVAPSRRAYTPGRTSRSPVRGSGYFLMSMPSGRASTPPASVSRSGSQNWPASSAALAAGGAATPPRTSTPLRSSRDYTTHDGSLTPSGGPAAPPALHTHTHTHPQPFSATADGSTPSAGVADNAFDAAAFAASLHHHGGLSPRHPVGGGFNTWSVSGHTGPHPGGHPSPGIGGGGPLSASGGSGSSPHAPFAPFGRSFPAASVHHSAAGPVYRSMPIAQVLGSQSEEVGTSYSPGWLSGRAGRSPPRQPSIRSSGGPPSPGAAGSSSSGGGGGAHLGYMRDRHSSANASLNSASSIWSRPTTSPSRSRSQSQRTISASEPPQSHAPPRPVSTSHSPKRPSAGAAGLTAAVAAAPPPPPPPHAQAAPHVIGGVVMSAGPHSDGSPEAPVVRGPLVAALPHYKKPAIRHCGFMHPTPGGSSTAAAAAAVAVAAGGGLYGSPFSGARQKSIDERMKAALLSKVLNTGGPVRERQMQLQERQQHMLQQSQPLPEPSQAPAAGAAAGAAAVPHAPSSQRPPLHRPGSLPHLPPSQAAGDHPPAETQHRAPAAQPHPPYGSSSPPHAVPHAGRSGLAGAAQAGLPPVGQELEGH